MAIVTHEMKFAVMSLRGCCIWMRESSMKKEHQSRFLIILKKKRPSRLFEEFAISVIHIADKSV
jgi:ABC-type polar amino acid transport system ATPase subunit